MTFSPEIEAATASIHAWWRTKLLLLFEPPVVIVPLKPAKPSGAPEGALRVPQAKFEPLTTVPSKKRAAPGINTMGKMLHVTSEAIKAKLAAGMKMREIAAEFGCHRSVLDKRLLASEGPVRPEERVCTRCSGTKDRYADICGFCRRKAKRAGKVVEG